MRKYLHTHNKQKFVSRLYKEALQLNNIIKPIKLGKYWTDPSLKIYKWLID